MEAISAINEDHQIEPTPPSSTTLPGEDQIQPPHFSITQETLASLLQPHQTYISNSRSVLPPSAFASILSGLQTDLDYGIPGGAADLYRRRTAFGSNLKFETSTAGGTGEFDNDGDICKILKETFKDPTIVMLLCCAVLSLAIGIKRDGLEEGLRDGTLLFLAIFVLVNFGTLGKFAKAKHRRWKLSSTAPKTMKVINVIRGGRMLKIPVSEIVVGDMLSLRPGDQVPADGLLVLNQGDSIPTLDDDDSTSPSTQHLSRLFSGSKVLQGNCRMLVTSVGENTQLTKLMKSTTREEDEPNKLLERVEKLNSVIEKVWACIILLILVVQAIMCFVPKPHCNCDADHNRDPKGVKNTVEEIMNLVTKKRGGFRAYNSGVVAGLCILIFALRDGLPLGIFILLILSSKKMKHYRKALVKKLPASATVGLVTTICSTTLNLEGSSQHHAKASSNIWMVSNNGDYGSTCVKEISPDSIDHQVLNTLREGVCMTAFGPQEDFLLWWAKQDLKIDAEEMKRSNLILYREDFDDQSGVRLIRKENQDRRHHVHRKGDIEKILPTCSNYYDADGTMQTLDDSKRAAIIETIANIISSSADILCCFALAYKQLDVEEEEEDGEQELVKQGLTLVSLVALKNPYSPELRQSVKTCTRELGVQAMMMVEDEVKTARLMATHLGILNPDNHDHMNDGSIIEASQFRKCSELEQDRMVKHIRVMANSSATDKLLMVQCLRRNGEVVAVIGKTTRDSPLLKEADVGLLITQNGSEIPKDYAGMVVLDLNCTTGCGLLTLGRHVCNSITRFLELQLTLTIVAYAVNLVVVLSTSEVPISPVQLLWFNLMMDVLGALALSASPMQTQPLVSAVITNKLWRNVAVHSVFQVIVLLMLYFKGEQIFGITQEAVNPILFNCFAVCQVFMLLKYVAGSTLPPKMVDTDRSLWLLLLAVAATGLAVQVAVVEISAAVLHSHKGRLSMKEWCICIAIASVSLVVDPAVNCFLSLFIRLGKACTDWLTDLCSHVFSDMVMIVLS